MYILCYLFEPFITIILWFNVLLYYASTGEHFILCFHLSFTIFKGVITFVCVCVGFHYNHKLHVVLDTL